jgi:hypothetical protein
MQQHCDANDNEGLACMGLNNRWSTMAHLGHCMKKTQWIEPGYEQRFI